MTTTVQISVEIAHDSTMPGPPIVVASTTSSATRTRPKAMFSTGTHRAAPMPVSTKSWTWKIIQASAATTNTTCVQNGEKEPPSCRGATRL